MYNHVALDLLSITFRFIIPFWATTAIVVHCLLGTLNNQNQTCFHINANESYSNENECLYFDLKFIPKDNDIYTENSFPVCAVLKHVFLFHQII